MMNQAGKYIFIAGLVLAAFGLIIWLAGNKLNWFGRLPGDIHVKREGFTFYMPLMTMILVSIVLSLMLWLFRRSGH